MKKYSIILFLLAALFFTAPLPARAEWTEKVGDYTFFCKTDNGDSFCDVSRKSPLYKDLFFTIIRLKNSSLDPNIVKEVFETVYGEDFILTDSHLADCGEKHDTYRIYRLSAKEKGTDLQAEILIRITLTSIYWVTYLHNAKDPAVDTVFTPRLLDAFCTQIF